MKKFRFGCGKFWTHLPFKNNEVIFYVESNEWVWVTAVRVCVYEYYIVYYKINQKRLFASTGSREFSLGLVIRREVIRRRIVMVGTCWAHYFAEAAY